MKQIAISVFLAVLGSFLIQPLANRFWQTPFDPKVLAGPYIWSLGRPAKGISFAVVFWLTFANEGETPGSIQNLKLRICLPKGDWVVHPRFVVDGKQYFEAFQEQKYDPGIFGEPFTPIYLPAKFQTTRSVLFLPWTDFNLAFLEAGNYGVTLSAQSLGSDFKDVWKGSFSVDQEAINNWNDKKQQIRRMLVQSEKPAPASCPMGRRN